MGRIGILAVAAGLIVATGCTTMSRVEVANVETQARAVLAEQVAAWNEGDIERFMETYWKSSDLRFASGAELRQGWDAARERYVTTYPDAESMGTVDFHVASVDATSPTTAVVFGQWHLTRSKGNLNGLFTLVLKEIDGTWVIVHDHTSAGEKPVFVER